MGVSPMPRSGMPIAWLPVACCLVALLDFSSWPVISLRLPSAGHRRRGTCGELTQTSGFEWHRKGQNGGTQTGGLHYAAEAAVGPLLPLLTGALMARRTEAIS